MLTESILVFIIVVYLYCKWTLGYWERNGVFSVKGEFFFGNIRDILLGITNLPDLLDKYYKEHKSHGLVGFYSFHRPMLLVTDPELIQEVLVKKFNCFADNGYRIYEKSDPMFGLNAFCTTGLQNWKKTRGIHGPFHSKSHLKEMYPLMQRVAGNLVESLRGTSSAPVDVMETTGYFTMENVAACAYGIEPSVFSDPENCFRKMTSKELFTSSFWANISALFCPQLAKIFPLRIVSKEAEDFFVNFVKSTIDYRIKQNTFGKDLIGYLMQYNQKLMNEKKSVLSVRELAGHSINVYLNGYETSASELAFLLLELARRPQLQERLREELLSLGGSSLAQFDFTKIWSGLPYLAATLNECLRKHPLLPILSRECTETTKIKDFIVPKGMKVFVPVRSLHYDSDYYPEPQEFRPERFEGDFNETTFLPFGGGPRMCQGMRFGVTQLRLATVAVLLHFRLQLPPDSLKTDEVPVEKDPPFVLTPRAGSRLIFKPLSEHDNLQQH